MQNRLLFFAFMNYDRFVCLIVSSTTHSPNHSLGCTLHTHTRHDRYPTTFVIVSNAHIGEQWARIGIENEKSNNDVIVYGLRAANNTIGESVAAVRCRRNRVYEKLENLIFAFAESVNRVISRELRVFAAAANSAPRIKFVPPISWMIIVSVACDKTGEWRVIYWP